MPGSIYYLHGIKKIVQQKFLPIFLWQETDFKKEFFTVH